MSPRPPPLPGGGLRASRSTGPTGLAVRECASVAPESTVAVGGGGDAQPDGQVVLPVPGEPSRTTLRVSARNPPAARDAIRVRLAGWAWKSKFSRVLVAAPGRPPFACSRASAGCRQGRGLGRRSRRRRECLRRRASLRPYPRHRQRQAPSRRSRAERGLSPLLPPRSQPRRHGGRFQPTQGRSRCVGGQSLIASMPSCLSFSR